VINSLFLWIYDFLKAPVFLSFGMQITKRNQKSVHHVITKIGQTNLGLAEQIHNRIRILA